MIKFILILLMVHFRLGMGDETTCMSDHEDLQSLHFVCFCNSPRPVSTQFEAEDIFSLADFAYNLSGALFSKSIYIRFQSCRYLRVLLDQTELSRIGSSFFRPDIQVRGISVEHVYHLDLNRHLIVDRADEYIAFPSEDFVISTFAVALVKIDRGARFSNLKANSNGTKIFIDLKNGGRLVNDDDFSINGFDQDHIYFITNTREDVPLFEGEDLHVKMKSLTAEMQERSHMLSLALSLSTIVILIGIFGLVVVANHRQKRKRQLKAILRAKNLGPVLESQKIAREVSDKILPKYRLVKKPSSGTIEHLGMTTAEIEEASHSKSGKYNINDLLSGILYRIRKSEYTPDHSRINRKSSEIPTLSSRIPKRSDTAFFYRDSSMSSTPRTSVSEDHDHDASRPHPSYGDVNHETVEVAIDKATKESSDEIAECSSDSASQKSYKSSKIAQKVFVDYSSPAQILKSSAFRGELKEKCMTFFSSVTTSPPSVSGSGYVVQGEPFPLPRPPSNFDMNSIASIRSVTRTKL